MSIILSLSTQPYSCRYSTGIIFGFALLRKMADSRSGGCNHGERFITLKKDLCVCVHVHTQAHTCTHTSSLFLTCGRGTRLRASGLVAAAFTHRAESSSWAYRELL